MIIVLLISIAIIIVGVVMLIREIHSYVIRTRNNRPNGTPDQPLANRKVNWGSITWMIGLTLLCLGIVAYGFYPQMTWSNVGYHCGRKMGQAGILWMVFFVTLGRKQGYKKGALSFVLIVAAGYASGRMSYTQGESEFEQVRAEFRKVLAEGTTAEGLAPLTQGQTSSAPALKGAAAEMHRFSTTCVNESVALQREYQRELDASGFADILNMARLERDGTLLESRMIVDNAKAIITKYRKKTDLLTENLEEEIKKLRLGAEAKADVLRGFKDSVREQRAARDTIRQCEEGVVAQMENIVALLSRKRNQWTIQGGEIQFYDEADSTEFNSYLMVIRDLALKQEEVQKQGVEAMKDLLK